MYAMIGWTYILILDAMALGFFVHRYVGQYNHFPFRLPTKVSGWSVKFRHAIKYVHWHIAHKHAKDKPIQRRIESYTTDFWQVGNTLVFYVFASAAIINGMINGKEHLKVVVFGQTIYGWLATDGIIILSVFCLVRLFKGSDFRIPAFIGMRPNAWIALAVTQSLWGDMGMVYFIVVLVVEETVGCVVWFFVIDCKESKLKAILTNPPFWACAAGLLCIAVGIESNIALNYFAWLCTPVSLFFVGAEMSQALLNFKKEDLVPILVGAFARLIVAPIGALLAFMLLKQLVILMALDIVIPKMLVVAFLVYLASPGSSVAYLVLDKASKKPKLDKAVYCNSLNIQLVLGPFTMLIVLLCFCI